MESGDPDSSPSAEGGWHEPGPHWRLDPQAAPGVGRGTEEVAPS